MNQYVIIAVFAMMSKKKICSLAFGCSMAFFFGENHSDLPQSIRPYKICCMFAPVFFKEK